jgi:hypothetical protein
MEETTMSLRKSIKLLGSATVAMAFGAGLLGAAHTASATPATATSTTTCGVLSPAGQPPSDSIKLPNYGGISFGSGGVDSSNNPICGATLQWTVPPNTVRPTLTGTLNMKNKLYTTAHVLVSYYDIHGNFLTSAIGGDDMATSNNQSCPVNIFMPNDPKIYSAAVSTQVEDLSTKPPTWSTLRTVNAYMGSANHPARSCTLDTVGVELGGSGGVSGGHPVNAATCGWVVTPTTVEATVSGTEWFENGQGLKAQIVLSVYDVHGNWLGESAFASNSPNKMGNVSFPAIGSAGAGILNNQIYSAQAVIQFWNSSTSTWVQQGSPVTWYI